MAKNEVKIVITGDAARFKKSLGEADTGLQKFQSKMEVAGAKLRTIGSTLTSSLTVPIVGAGIVATKWAMDAEEATNKVNVVFGDNAVFIDHWAKTSATAFGLSKGEAMDAFGTMGTMLQGFGIETAKLPTMSNDLLTLAADLGSFHNLRTPEVLDMISAAFRGEYDSIQRVIPTINAAAVEHKALEMTGKKSADQLTAQEKALAVHALLMEGAGSATGDFARTQDSASNSTKVATAKLKTAAETIGANLLPIVVTIADKVAELSDKFSNLSPTTQKFIVVGLVLAAALGPVVSFIGALVTGFGFLATAIGFLFSPIGLVVAGLVGIAAALVYLYKNNEGFRNWVKDVASSLKDKLGQAIKTFREDIWPGLVKAFNDFKDDVLPKLKDAWNDFVDNVWPRVVDAFTRFKDEIWPKLIEAFNTFKDDVLPVLVEKFKWFKDEVVPVLLTVAAVVKDVVAIVTDNLFRMLNAFISVWGTVITIVTGAMRLFAGVVSVNMSFIQGIISGGLQMIQGLFNIFGGVIKGSWSQAWDGVKQVVSGAFSIMKAGVSSFYNSFVAPVVLYASSIKNAFSTAFSGVGTAASSAWNAVKSAWNNSLGGRSITLPDFPGLPGRGQTFTFPRLHTGGIVPGRRGAEVMANLQAGEMVLSLAQVDALRKAQSVAPAGGGGTVINVTVNAGVGDAAEIGRKTVEAIKAYEARNGSSWRVA